jgi:hypothetical protein
MWPLVVRVVASCPMLLSNQTCSVAAILVILGSGLAAQGCQDESPSAPSAARVTYVDPRPLDAGVIRGVVVDAEEHPVARAHVKVWQLPRYQLGNNTDELCPPPTRIVVADDAGAFSVAGLGPYVILEAEAPGLAAVQSLEGCLLREEVVAGRRLRLAPASAIEGRVVDPQGRPVVNRLVTAQKASWHTPLAGVVSAPPVRLTTATDAEGHFSLRPLAPGNWWVCCEETSTGNWAQWVETGLASVEIQLIPPFTVPCTVVGADGAALSGAKVVAVGTKRLSPIQFAGKVDVHTDASGHALIPALVPSDEVSIGVVASGRAFDLREGVAISPGMSPIEFRLQPESVCFGKVIDETGSPASGLELSWSRMNNERTSLVDGLWLHRLGLWRITTGMSGQFSRGQLAPGDYWVELAHPASPSRCFYATVSAGDPDVRLQVDWSGASVVTVTGKFRDAVTHDPIIQAFVWLEAVDPHLIPKGAWMPGSMFSEFEGEYEIESAPPGRYRLRASDVGNDYAKWFGPPTDFAAGRHEIDIDMQRARTLALRVARAGKPVEGARVDFRTPEGQPIDLGDEPQGDGTIGVTDRFGEIVAPQLPAIALQVVVTLPGAAKSEEAITLPPRPVDLATHTGEVVEIAVP